MRTLKRSQTDFFSPVPVVCDGELFTPEKTLRLLPQKRWVCRGEWKSRKVILKHFHGHHHLRDAKREISGLNVWQQFKLPCPNLLHHEHSKEFSSVILEDLGDFETLAQKLTNQRKHILLPDPDLTEHLHQIIGWIGRMHAFGIIQTDLHLDNLLLTPNGPFFLDGGGVNTRVLGKPIEFKDAMINLAIFFAQLPLSYDDKMAELLDSYAFAFPLHQMLINDLKKSTLKFRRWRMQDLKKKSQRNCTLYAHQTSAQLEWACLKENVFKFLPDIASIDSAIEHGSLFKTGGAATVAMVTLQEMHLVVKRYNVKHGWHFLKRCWRRGRSWNAWGWSQLLPLLGLATPLTWAIMQKRHAWLRGRAYVLSEHLPGQSMMQLFGDGSQKPENKHLEALEFLFASMIKMQISHGDMKAHNFLWSNEQWAMIDLDAMRMHHSERAFKKAYERDRKRFLANWPISSKLHHEMEAYIPQL